VCPPSSQLQLLHPQARWALPQALRALEARLRAWSRRVHCSNCHHHGDGGRCRCRCRCCCRCCRFGHAACLLAVPWLRCCGAHTPARRRTRDPIAMSKLLLCAFACVGLAAAASGPLAATRLRANFQDSPAVILPGEGPTLSWVAPHTGRGACTRSMPAGDVAHDVALVPQAHPLVPLGSLSRLAVMPSQRTCGVREHVPLALE
jgi:hypothetical protein